MSINHRLEIGDFGLKIEDVLEVANNQDLKIELAKSVKPRMAKSHRYVKDAVEEFLRLPQAAKLESPNLLIYGVNTGFGALKDTTVTTTEQAKVLQQNIVRSHAAGVGNALDVPIIRAAMLLQAHALASGRSGVRYGVVERLTTLLNRRIHPVVPEQGSVGASGDLAPLAHAALVSLGKGKAEHNGKVFVGKNVEALLREEGILDLEWKDFDLDYKEGLALVNGTYITTAIALLAYQHAENLIKHADIAGCMSLEAALGHTRAFDKIVHEARPHQGQKDSAENFRKLFSSKYPNTGELALASELLNKSELVHDCYSLRCAPQVHGTAREALRFARNLLIVEINAITDDPILFDPEELSGNDMSPIDGLKDKLHFEEGNFHGQPIALAMDVLSIAMTTLGAISERRVQMLLDKNHNNGLPAQLIRNDDGTNSGLMIAQYTAAALVAENKTLSCPASTESIPTSANYEDHVSMAPIAGRKATKIMQNVENILAIEFLCAAHALGFRSKLLRLPPPAREHIRSQGTSRLITGKPGKGSQTAMEAICSALQLIDGKDQELHGSISTIAKMIRTKKILVAVEKVLEGKLL